jgi:uncharacterized repeat protein (TIGR02543 family)
MKKYLTLVLAVVSVLIACNNAADTPREELARVRIGVVSDTQGVTDTRGVSARSVLPTVPTMEDIERFALYGTASGKNPNNPDYKESWLVDFVYQDGVLCDYQDPEKSAVVYVRPGEWRFTLYAYQGEDAALKGTVTATITAGFAGIIDFTLAPYSDGNATGSVFIYIGLPEGSSVASVEMTIDGEPLDPPLAIDADAVIYESNETPTGQYLFTFALKDPAGKTVAVISDIIIVSAGLESAKGYTLTDEDFNGPPAPPSAFTVASYNAENQTFHFTWQDNSFNETGWTLFDGTTTHDIAAATQSFDLSVADPTSPVTYTLKAVNSFGESAPAHISGLIVFTVTFDAENGNAAQTRQVSLNGSIGARMPANPTKTDSTFDGWYTARNGGGSAFTADATITRNITVYAKWIEGVIYELTKNPAYDNYICNTSNLLPSGFTLDMGDQITISLSIKTNTALAGFYVGIGDWNNNGSYNGDNEDGWIATGWRNTKSVAADGQFHAYTWTLTALASAPLGSNPLVFRFAANGVSEAIVYVKDASITKSPSVFSNLSLAESFAWLANNAEEGGEYIIVLKNSETVAPQTLSYEGKNVSIALNGSTTERIVSLSANGSLFTIDSGVTLTLGSNVVLQGRNGNTASLVQVNSGGALTLKNGSKVSGNTRASSYSYGGGVYVNGGVLTLNGGEISGNRAAAAAYSSYGGGVYMDGGVLTVNGGKISGNSVAASAPSSYSYGGGVFVNSGVLTLNGGEISGNRASTASYNSYGGGVFVNSNGTWTMNDGKISDNSVSSSTSYGALGGGVVVRGTWTMSGGEISGNSASTASTSTYGGGVFMYDGGTWTMSGGEISGNSASTSAASHESYGGGVFVDDNCTWTMSGGEISGNTSTHGGGGVFVWEKGTFTKQAGGTIYGSDASDSLKNIARDDSYGHAVRVNGSPVKLRNSTAGSEVILRSAISGSAGGWE